MRALTLALVLPLAACGSGQGGNDTAAQGGNAEAPLPKATGPAPRTPVTQISPEPGNEAEWMAPQPAAGDPTSAPYANLLDQPLVDAPPKR